jgi:hypothetical protein
MGRDIAWWSLKPDYYREGQNFLKKKGYSTNSYIKSLEEELIPIYKPGLIFQQDNTKIY